jgi:hypothetical protein
MKELDKRTIWQIIMLLYKGLQKPGAWYTGLSIKKYLLENVLHLGGSPLDNIKTSNPSIQSGRWSAYCHFSRLLAFKNLLDKHGIKPGDHILVHPLLPEPLIEELLERKTYIETIDIGKMDLGFDQNALIQYFEEREPDDNFPVLIIDYAFSGIYKPMLDTLQKAYQLAIPSLLIIDNENLNVRLTQIFTEHKLGSVLWFYGDGFLDDQINLTLGENVENHPWYISWYLETRTRSLLEYHLSQSHEIFLPLFKNYLYLLLKRYSTKYNWLAFPLPFLAQRLVLKLPTTDTKKTTAEMLNLYEQSFEYAIPDIVFDLQNQVFHDISLAKYPSDLHNLVDFSAQVHMGAKRIYDYLRSRVPTRQPGTIEVPFFYTDRTYLEYFFYTSETDFWYRQLDAMSLNGSSLPALHPIIGQNTTIPNAQFAVKYLLSIDLTA